MRKAAQLIPLVTILMLAFNHQAAAQKQWRLVGNAGFSAGVAEYTSLSVDNNGIPYVAYRDGANGNKVTVMKYDGAKWMAVGNAGFSADSTKYTSLVVDNNGTPYVAYKDWANGRKATVMKYNGSNWVAVGNTGFSAGVAEYTSLTLGKNGTPYIAYCDSANNAEATVMKYNGTNWVVVGNTGFSPDAITSIYITVDSRDTPYVAFTDYSSNGSGYSMKYDGTNWKQFGYQGSGNFSNPEINLLGIKTGKNDTPYVAYYYKQVNNGISYMKKFDGNGWTSVGDIYNFPNIRAFDINSTGIPYAVIKDPSYNRKSSAILLDSTSWSVLGQPGFSAGYIGFTIIVLSKDNTPYVAYLDSSNNNKLTVMKYGCSQNATIGICAVLTDTTVGGDMTIVWDGSTISGVDSYKIYRETSGSYIHIGSVPGYSSSYTDITALPSLQSYKYKLTYIDECGMEMPLDSSIAHKSVWLRFNYLIDGKASITWNGYEGIPNLTYTVKRSNNGSAFSTIASFGMSGTDTTYIDINPPSGNNRYRIDIVLTNPCSVGSVNYSKITSNTVTSWNTGVSEIDRDFNVVLIPNPADDYVKFSISRPVNGYIVIYNVSGAEVSRNAIKGVSAVMQTAQYINGIYTYRFFDEKNAVQATGRIVIKH